MLGKVATDEEIDKLVSVNGQVKSLVDAQGKQMDDIELNVANARVYINGGTNRLISTNAMKKKGGYLV
ncbi:hypothetical protein IFM89_029927 [Coptis chinensis]|uniref:t-SNARE coiled-coil homology domain-containing protein n=1 Tax=Coptis chinensis TaxID=261450 RepID=A0A835HHY8_9MAGN|nr:hypothetical protein IFM89_029927 [Coptis chinensis]